MVKIDQVYKNKEDCSGCTACMHICPTKAITMVEDIEGFQFPLIDLKKCIQCGRCQKTCPFNEEKFKQLKNDMPVVYAIKHVDDNVRLDSTSGGAFTALSDYILSEKGVIYGVGYNKNMEVVHKRVHSKSQRDKLRGSKYIQSDLSNIFEKIKEDLDNGTKVLFTGTPCQVAGLKSFLINSKTNHDNLVLCDIVCHGTPSPLVWREHVKLVEKKYKSKMVDYMFRTKEKGWKTHIETIVLEDGTKDNISLFSKKFARLFQANIDLRLACHNCHFANINRVSDITIGDFWGLEKTMPEFIDSKGVSLILINTKKAEDIFDIIKKDLIAKKSSPENCLQPNLVSPTSQNKKRQDFFNYLSKKGYEKALIKYTTPPIHKRIKNKIIRTIKTAFKYN